MKEISYKTDRELLDSKVRHIEFTLERLIEKVERLERKIMTEKK